MGGRGGEGGEGEGKEVVSREIFAGEGERDGRQAGRGAGGGLGGRKRGWWESRAGVEDQKIGRRGHSLDYVPLTRQAASSIHPKLVRRRTGTATRSIHLNPSASVRPKFFGPIPPKIFQSPMECACIRPVSGPSYGWSRGPSPLRLPMPGSCEAGPLIARVPLRLP